MGISFADIVDKSKELTIPVGGGSLTISYDPSALSPAKISKMNKELKRAQREEEAEDEDGESTETSLMGVATMFCSIVKSWDLTGPIGEDEEGEPLVAAGEAVPVTPEYVAWLPSPIISHIIEKVGEDASPKGKKRR